LSVGWIDFKILHLKLTHLRPVWVFSLFCLSLGQAEEVLFQDEFDKDLSRWVIEQTPNGSTKIIDGQLDIDDAPGPKDKGGCTVWFKEKLKGP